MSEQSATPVEIRHDAVDVRGGGDVVRADDSLRSDDAPRPDVAPRIDIIRNLARLINASALYPATHPRIVDIATPILAAVRAAPPDAPFAVSARNPEPGESPNGNAARLRRELDHLGFAHIELAPEVSLEDLVAFALFLREHVGLGPAAVFRHADLSTLPATIRVFERSFADSEFAGDAKPLPPMDGEGGEGAPGQVRPQTEEEERVVALVCRAVVAMLEGSRDPGIGPPEIAPAGRAAILAAAAAVQQWIERHTAGTLRSRNAAEILAEAERVLPRLLPGVGWRSVLDVIGRAIDEHLLDRFRRESRADFDGETGEATETERFEMPADDLARAVEGRMAEAEPFELASSVDGRERLSVLLRMLGESCSRAGAVGIARRLSACFAASLEPPVRDVLVEWLRDASRSVSTAELDRRVGAVTTALRGVRRSVVAEVLLDACAPPHRYAVEPLWPHLAYELVIYDEVSGESRKAELSSLVVTVPRTKIRDEADRLVAIVSRGTDPVATSVFLPPRAALYPIYEILIDAPRGPGFAAAVTSAFKRHPPSHPAAGALVALAPTDERARRLVARLLREGDSQSPALRALAVEILVDSLRSLPPQRRDAVWVESAIRALGRLPCPASAAMVREVLKSRRRLFNSGWPAFARRAAVEAAAVGDLA